MLLSPPLHAQYTHRNPWQWRGGLAWGRGRVISSAAEKSLGPAPLMVSLSNHPAEAGTLPDVGAVREPPPSFPRFSAPPAGIQRARRAHGAGLSGGGRRGRGPCHSERSRGISRVLPAHPVIPAQAGTSQPASVIPAEAGIQRARSRRAHTQSGAHDGVWVWEERGPLS